MAAQKVIGADGSQEAVKYVVSSKMSAAGMDQDGRLIQCYSSSLNGLGRHRYKGGGSGGMWKAGGPFGHPVGPRKSYDNALSNLDHSKALMIPRDAMKVSLEAVAIKGVQMKQRSVIAMSSMVLVTTGEKVEPGGIRSDLKGWDHQGNQGESRRSISYVT